MALYPSESEKINMKSIFQKITVQKVVKGFRYLKHYGWKEFIIRLQEKMEAENVPYEPWYEKHKATAEQIEKQKKQAEKWNDAPKISIVVPLFKTPETFLRAMSPYRRRPMATGSYALRMAVNLRRKKQILDHQLYSVLQPNMHRQMYGSGISVLTKIWGSQEIQMQRSH